MRVVVPYTRLRRPVVRALDATGREWEPVDVSGSDRAYYDLLARLWDAGDTFCLVEHDVVIHDTTLDELDGCDQDWCGFPHPYMGHLAYGLGCVKFTSRLIGRNPQAVDRVGVMFDERHAKRHWCRLDAWLQGAVLPHAGEHMHRHTRPLRHLGRGSGHRCI